MRVLFWNIQSGNPLNMAEANKGQAIARQVAGSGADVIVFCEVTNEALDQNDFTTLLMNAASEKINVKEEWATKSVRDRMRPRLIQPLKAKYKMGTDRLKLGVGRGRRSVRVGARFNTVRRSRAAMGDIISAVNSVASSGAAAKFRQLRRVNAIRSQLEAMGVPKLKLDYEFDLGSEAIQNNRHYLVLAKRQFEHRYIDVTGVAGAKRQILILNFGNVQIPVIHAPSFGKGGGETVIQLARFIAGEHTPTVAIGDWNIDFEELWKEIEEEAAGKDYEKLFTNLGVMPVPPGKPLFSTTHERTWHRYRGAITKTYCMTQKSGGTLDYALAPSGLDVSVKIHTHVGNSSDHASIIVDIDV